MSVRLGSLVPKQGIFGLFAHFSLFWRNTLIGKVWWTKVDLIRTNAGLLRPHLLSARV